jgi:flagellar biosynthetic protein FlhB
MADLYEQERTEQATPKRLREAREQGQIARSRDLNSLILLLAASGGLLGFGDMLLDALVRLMHMGLAAERASLFDIHYVQTILGKTMLDALLAFLPFLGLLFIASLLAPMALGGWTFSPQAIGPKWDRLDPVKGVGRIFSTRGLMEALKAFAKFLVVAVASSLLLYHLEGEMLDLGDEPLETGLAHMAHLLGWSFLGLSAVLILIAAVDVPFQLWSHARQLKMTIQQVKDEHKETDGNPEIKSRIRAVQRQLAQHRMMADVPTADVVITNPTHYAVALRYDQLKMGAPTVVAKGADLMAAQIRMVAEANGVMKVEAPPLARALYFNVEIGKEIPAGLYMAVAQVLAYVYQLKQPRTGGGEPPSLSPDLPVPEEFLKHQ